MSGDRIIRVLIALFALVFVVTAGPFLVASMLESVYESSRVSELEYAVTLTASADLSDVILFVPLPTEGSGVSPVIEELGSEESQYTFAGFPVSIYGANNESYLKVTIDQFSHAITNGSATLRIVVPSPALHTRLPLVYDYTLLPKRGLALTPCPISESSEAVCYSYQSLIFASFNASPDTSVEVQVDLRGSNEWHILREYRNGYTDQVRLTLEGPAEGWHAAEGRMVTSIGEDTPFWKERLPPEPRTHPAHGIDTSMMRWHTFTPLP